MDGASPWVCHSNALEFYGPYQAITIVEVPAPIVDISQIPSTVVIEELESDESDGSSESSASASGSVEVAIPIDISQIPSTVAIEEVESDESY